jgi:hypothetical protein
MNRLSKNKVLFYLLLLIVLFQTCKDNNSTNPSDNNNNQKVSFVLQYSLNGSGDTLWFSAKPNFLVKLNNINCVYPDSQIKAYTNLNIIWDSTNSYRFDHYSPFTGIYKFNFEGIRVFDNSAFDTTLQTTFSGGGQSVHFSVNHFLNFSNDTLNFYGNPNIRIKLDSLISFYPDNSIRKEYYNGFDWSSSDTLIFDNYKAINGSYQFRFKGKVTASSILFDVIVLNNYP